MKHVVIAFGGVVSSFLFACGSAPVPDPGVTGPTLTQNCDVSQQNANGVCYPTQDIGTTARSGNVAGNRIADFAFTGYKAMNVTPIAANGVPSATQTIHLGDYYNPCTTPAAGCAGGAIPNVINGVPVVLIHLTVAAVWCTPCNEETDFIAGANYTGANTGNASFASELAPKGVVFVQAIDDGPVVGIGATISDLNNWILPQAMNGRHNSDFTSMVDPNNANLGVFFDAAAVPFNANIDARSMEILSTDVGFDTQLDQTIEQTYLTWIAANAPKQ